MKHSRNKAFFYEDWTRALLRKVLFVKKSVNPSYFFAYCLLYIFFVIWGLSFFDETNFVLDPYGSNDSFISRINLVFHEAGHMIFYIFGKFIYALGGTLGQCLIPLIVMFQFLRQKDNFSASIALWWLGQNFIDISPYIYDAWDQKLTLLGGVTGRDLPGVHDWRYLLTATNSLESYAKIASFVGNLGKVIMALSFLWGGIILYKQFLILKANGFKKLLKV